MINNIADFHLPDFRREVVPNMHRRAKWNDYRDPRIYMLTMCAETAGCPFGCVEGDCTQKCGPSAPHIALSQAGYAVAMQSPVIQSLWPQVKILQQTVMPDHVHLLVYVRERIEDGLSAWVRNYKGLCGRAVCGDEDMLFMSGYHDRIVTRQGQKDVLYNYIVQNPYRLLLRRQHPELFVAARVRAADLEWDAVGDVLLLHNPVKAVVRFSSKFSDAELRRRSEVLQEVARQRGVVVSPFVHPWEREQYRLLMSQGACVVMLTDRRYDERNHPKGQQHEQCAAGALLLMTPPDGWLAAHPEGRRRFMGLNALAEAIAGAAPADVQVYRTRR